MSNLVDENGRFILNSIKEFVLQSSLRAFLTEVPHAVLIGSALYKGWFDMEIPDNEKATVMFLQSPEEKTESTKLKILENHMYPLAARKDPAATEAKVATCSSVFTVTLGRSPQNDIVLFDKSISAKHVEFRVENSSGTQTSAYFLRDLGSSNGTSINDKRIKPFWTEELHAGNEIRFGRFSLVLITPTDLYNKLREIP